jgi:transcription initiation factor TFIID subunit 10
MQSQIITYHSLDSSVLINECKFPFCSLLVFAGCLILNRKRLLALCTQKFISDLATDAYQFSKIRSSSSTSAAVPQMGARVGRPGKDKGRSVLTLEDLSAALGDGGVNVKRPEFYR